MLIAGQPMFCRSSLTPLYGRLRIGGAHAVSPGDIFTSAVLASHECCFAWLPLRHDTFVYRQGLTKHDDVASKHFCSQATRSGLLPTF